MRVKRERCGDRVKKVGCYVIRQRGVIGKDEGRGVMC